MSSSSTNETVEDTAKAVQHTFSSHECKSPNLETACASQPIDVQLEEILGGLNSSRSTTPSLQLQPSPIPSSRAATSGSLNWSTDGMRDTSSEDGAEDEMQLDQDRFGYGDEMSDGYEDEDRSMTSSENEMVFEANTERMLSEEALSNDFKSTISDAPICHSQTQVGGNLNDEGVKVSRDTIEENTNTSYIDEAKEIHSVTRSMPQVPQNKKQLPDAKIEDDLVKGGKTKLQHPQAAARPYLYSVDFMYDYFSAEDQVVESGLANPPRIKSGHSLFCPGKEDLRPHASVQSRQESIPASRTTRLGHEVIAKAIEAEEQATLKELEKFRDIDLGPAEEYTPTGGQTNNETRPEIGCGTPVRNAYEKYLLESMRYVSGGDEQLSSEENENIPAAYQSPLRSCVKFANKAPGSSASSPPSLHVGTPSPSPKERAVSSEEPKSQDALEHDNQHQQHPTFITVIALLPAVAF